MTLVPVSADTTVGDALRWLYSQAAGAAAWVGASVGGAAATVTGTGTDGARGEAVLSALRALQASLPAPRPLDERETRQAVLAALAAAAALYLSTDLLTAPAPESRSTAVGGRGLLLHRGCCGSGSGSYSGKRSRSTNSSIISLGSSNNNNNRNNKKNRGGGDDAAAAVASVRLSGEAAAAAEREVRRALDSLVPQALERALVAARVECAAALRTLKTSPQLLALPQLKAALQQQQQQQKLPSSHSSQTEHTNKATAEERTTTTTTTTTSPGGRGPSAAAPVLSAREAKLRAIAALLERSLAGAVAAAYTHAVLLHLLAAKNIVRVIVFVRRRQARLAMPPPLTLADGNNSNNPSYVMSGSGGPGAPPPLSSSSSSSRGVFGTLRLWWREGSKAVLLDRLMQRFARESAVAPASPFAGVGLTEEDPMYPEHLTRSGSSSTNINNMNSNNNNNMQRRQRRQKQQNQQQRQRGAGSDTSGGINNNNNNNNINGAGPRSYPLSDVHRGGGGGGGGDGEDDRYGSYSALDHADDDIIAMHESDDDMDMYEMAGDEARWRCEALFSVRAHWRLLLLPRVCAAATAAVAEALAERRSNGSSGNSSSGSSPAHGPHFFHVGGTISGVEMEDFIDDVVRRVDRAARETGCWVRDLPADFFQRVRGEFGASAAAASSRGDAKHKEGSTGTEDEDEDDDDDIVIFPEGNTTILGPDGKPVHARAPNQQGIPSPFSGGVAGTNATGDANANDGVSAAAAAPWGDSFASANSNNNNNGAYYSTAAEDAEAREAQLALEDSAVCFRELISSPHFADMARYAARHTFSCAAGGGGGGPGGYLRPLRRHHPLDASLNNSNNNSSSHTQEGQQDAQATSMRSGLRHSRRWRRHGFWSERVCGGGGANGHISGAASAPVKTYDAASDTVRCAALAAPVERLRTDVEDTPCELSGKARLFFEETVRGTCTQ